MKKQFTFIFVIVFVVMLGGYTLFNFFEPLKETVDMLEPTPKKLVIHEVDEMQEVSRAREPEEIQKPKIREQEQAHQEEVIEVEAPAFEMVEEVKILPSAPELSVHEELLRLELERGADALYSHCHNLKKSQRTRKGIRNALRTYKLKNEKLQFFVVDFNGDTVLGENSKEDVDARSILLEEVQKVRRSGGGFIVSRVDFHGLKRYIVVKRLDIGNLFIGVDMYDKIDS